MENKEDELLSVQYRIEKSGMKQQKLENRLASISEELKRSKRNSLVFMIFFLTVIAVMAGGMYYLNQNNDAVPLSQEENTQTDLDEIKGINDSLRKELTKLKSDIADYRKEFIVVTDSTKTSVVDTTDTDKTKLKYIRKHCFVKRVFRNNGVVFIEVDFIEYFKGKRAVKKAKENNDAEYDINKEGDTLYFLYDNYYVYNKDTKLIRLELNDKIRIQDVNQISNGFPLKAFQRIIKDNPIMIIEIRDGIVYKMTKQKLP
ncbi:hypothetical protein [Aquimarina sp. 2201CG14-23]|uniref:hypothetical protein n=1 Tax=Aquimarina mycalae TaxID=3040073 RepID=UPI002477CE69|nr:hypothetical protein [Aquimarina sp. 2201CG14-23]MDH7445758.1 hypothetical protein [Aquimarina sp. 2201CG14-23]